MERSRAFCEAAGVKKSLFDQGFLDEQFRQLEELQDDLSPNFVEEVVNSFFRDSARLMVSVEQTLENVPHNLTRLDELIYQLKGSCSSIGAVRVRNECSRFREYYSQRNAQGCLASFRRIKSEHAALRQKLEAYFQVASRRAGPIRSVGRSVGAHGLSPLAPPRLFIWQIFFY
ncbi:unnamed protein product [Spirodela intermedia]|uniref:Histidine-containing phosphotransfer protein n=2 Tax=Spirodela intermedia TaxID=51605 RepID=A0A7I8JUH8_SPIIN|nr:unnamed protein product [Spirodela intermedia]CAA6673273.1 unnamed protein product [Spirodela intermedia]CAA7410496.1 unnamed protein product [Spirodela intermedia]